MKPHTTEQTKDEVERIYIIAKTESSYSDMLLEPIEKVNADHLEKLCQRQEWRKDARKGRRN